MLSFHSSAQMSKGFRALLTSRLGSGVAAYSTDKVGGC